MGFVMTSPHAARRAKLQNAVDRVFGETFTFTGKQVAANGDVNLPMVDDGSKPAFTVKGAWENLTDQNYPMARGSNPDDEAQRRAMQYPSVLVQTALLQWQPGRGDICTHDDEGTTYEVLRALPDGRGRMLFTLTNRRRPT